MLAVKKFFYIIFLAAFCVSCSARNGEKAEEVAKTEADCTVPVAVAPVAADGKVIELDDASLLAPGVKVSQLTVVDFNAVWCGPCRQLAPVVEEAAEKYRGKVTFISVDVDKYGDLMDAYHLGNSIPVVLFIKPDGTSFHYVGTSDLLPAEKFDKLIESNL